MGIALAAGAAVAGIAGSAISAGAAGSAADKQAAASRYAADLQAKQQAQTRADLLPYNQAGQANLPTYQNYWQTTTNGLNDAYNQMQSHIPQPMTQAQLEATPGYNFNLQQGLKSVQNSAAARGLGVSGASLKGAASYATGLADSTYQNQFNNAQTIYGDYGNLFNNRLNQYGQTFSQLSAPVNLGENAAATSGNIGQQAYTNIGNNIAAAGQAQAAGITTQANAINNGLNSAASAPLNYLAWNKFLNNGSSGSGSTYDPSASGYTAGGSGTGTLQDLGFYTPVSGG